MGRHSEGWKLDFDERYGTHRVRFTHRGQRVSRSTGEADPGEAAKVAARIYAETISGRRQSVVGFSKRDAVDEVAALWLADLESTLDERTVDTYGLYVSGLWQPTFNTIDRITEATAADYWRKRLKSVQRTTVKKELSALRGFLSWCQGNNFISEVPRIDSPPVRATGTRAKKYNPKREPTLFTEEQAFQIIAELPDTLYGRRNKKRYHVRARFQVAWETGLRPATLDELRAPEDYKKGASVIKIRDEIDKARFGREVPLTDRAREALDVVCPDVGLLFGRHDYRAPLAAACTAAGLPRVTPYDFRHSRTTDLVENSKNLAGVQHLVGHKNISTTARYVHASLRAAKEVIAGLKNTGRADQNPVRRGRK